MIFNGKFVLFQEEPEEVDEEGDVPAKEEL